MKKEERVLSVGKDVGNYKNLIKKLIKHGIPKKKAEELTFHFFEIEAFGLGFKADLLSLLKSKKKEELNDALNSIYSELDGHLENHLNPTKKILKHIF